MVDLTVVGLEECVATLIRKSADVADSDRSMRYSQAALNSAHALSILRETERDSFRAKSGA